MAEATVGAESASRPAPSTAETQHKFDKVHSVLEELLEGVQIDFLGHANVMVLGMSMLVGPPLWFRLNNSTMDWHEIWYIFMFHRG